MYKGVERQLISKQKLPIKAERKLRLSSALISAALPAIMIMQPITVRTMPIARTSVTRSVPRTAAAIIVKMGCEGCQREAVTAPASCTPIKLKELPVCRKRIIKKNLARLVVKRDEMPGVT